MTSAAGPGGRRPGSSDLDLEPGWQCVTCGQPASGRYCSLCGERRPDLSRYALAHLFTELFESLFHFDAKAFVTLRALFAHPGHLTRDYLRGRRKPFVAPLQLFLICNIVFFFVQPRTGLEILAPPLDTQISQAYGVVTRPLAERYLAAHHLTIDTFRAPFYRTTELQARSLVGLMVPLFALLVALVEWRSGRSLTEHVIFSLHLYAAWLLWLSGALAATALMLRTPGLHWGPVFDTMLTVVEFVPIGVYCAFALPAVYGDRPLAAGVKAGLLTGGSFLVLHVYRFILFFTTLAAA